MSVLSGLNSTDSTEGSTGSRTITRYAPIQDDKSPYSTYKSLWRTGLPHVTSMAQDGGDLVVRQPTSVHGSPPGSRPILLPPGWRNRNLLALRSATGDEARPNDYVDTNNDRLNGRNNNESPNSRSAENSGDEGHLRTDLIVVRGPKGKAKVLRVVKSKPDEKPKSKSEQSSPTTPTHGGDLHGKGDEKLSKDPFPCPQCGCCRCEKCKNSNRLPSTWCCNGRCEFSPECVLNCCTCMTCVKSLFYHCARESDTEYAYCTDDPCSCRPHRRCARWTCLSLLSLCLPCLCCYLPGRGALEAYRQCQSQGRQGCQCSRWENGEAYDAL